MPEFLRRRIRSRSWQTIAVLAVGTIFLVGPLRLDAPPRFDGAGYATLALSLQTGGGYREPAHPDTPPHTHFPPGYPLTLASLWTVLGAHSPESRTRIAHAASVVFTLGALFASLAWFRHLFGLRVAFLLALALAVNPRWSREGGAFRSEPLFLLLSALVVLMALRAGRQGTARSGVWLGLLLGAATLTRHVGITLALAVAIDLAQRSRWRTLLASALTMALVILPWFLWLATADRPTQADLLEWSDLPTRLASQTLFYIQRIPDQIIGPVVEVGTVFRPRWTIPMTVFSALSTTLILFGWIRLGTGPPRRRLAALIPMATLALLIVWPFTEAGRFLLPLVPTILIGACEGTARLVPRMSRIAAPRRLAAWALVLASLPYTAYSWYADRAGAEEALHAGFDAACQVLAAHPEPPGPVLSRYAAETFWLTGRQALEPVPSAEPDAIEAQIESRQVAYLLVEQPRFARAEADPLNRFVSARPDRVEPVWSNAEGTALYRIRPAMARLPDDPPGQKPSGSEEAPAPSSR